MNNPTIAERLVPVAPPEVPAVEQKYAGPVSFFIQGQVHALANLCDRHGHKLFHGVSDTLRQSEFQTGQTLWARPGQLEHALMFPVVNGAANKRRYTSPLEARAASESAAITDTAKAERERYLDSPHPGEELDQELTRLGYPAEAPLPEPVLSHIKERFEQACADQGLEVVGWARNLEGYEYAVLHCPALTDARAKVDALRDHFY